MATKSDKDRREKKTLVPPPVPGGTEYVNGTWTWLDNLMGDRRMREAVDREARKREMHVDELPEGFV